MSDPSLLQRLKERKLVRWLRPSQSVLVLVLFAVILDLTTPFGFGGGLLALGFLWLINALLLRTGLMKPGSILGGETPWGVSLIGIGAIGIGVLLIPLEHQMNLPAFLVGAAFGMLFSVGVFVEWKARRERKSKSGAND